MHGSAAKLSQVQIIFQQRVLGIVPATGQAFSTLYAATSWRTDTSEKRVFGLDTWFPENTPTGVGRKVFSTPISSNHRVLDHRILYRSAI